MQKMIDYVPMKSEHIDGMVEVEEQCFNSGYAKKTFEKELENKIARYFVALYHGKVVGYAGYWNACGVADIIDVATHTDYRRKGIGQGLVKCLVDACREDGVSELNLEVRVSNTAAIGLYEKMGFSMVGKRKNYYENKEDAYLMQIDFGKGENNEDTCN